MLVATPFSTEEVVKAVSGMLVNGDMGIPFKGICTDTRVMEPGFLFWALKGRNFDGHLFWKEAIDKGARGVVLEYFPRDLELEELPKTLSFILVKDTLRALGDLAQYFRVREGFRVIAITGSCGKTTTKELTFALLSRFFKCAKNEANYNNLIGVPLSLLSFKDRPEWAILELGTNQRGEIARLAEITQPQVSLITCIYPAHLEGLGSLEGILEEKIALFERTDAHGTLIYFYDQPLLRERTKAFPQAKISYGEGEGADLRLLNFRGRGLSLEAQIAYGGKEYTFSAPLAGKHNLLNLLGALAVGLATGLTLESLLEAIEEMESLFLRSHFIQKGPYLLIDDTYNANPGSMEMALTLLSDQEKALGKRIAILGDMKELGEEAERYHEEVGEIAGEKADMAIFIGEMAPYYARGFQKSGKPCQIYHTVEEFLERGNLPKEKAVILVKGSRALRMERIVEKLVKEEN